MCQPLHCSFSTTAASRNLAVQRTNPLVGESTSLHCPPPRTLETLSKGRNPQGKAKPPPTFPDQHHHHTASVLVERLWSFRGKPPPPPTPTPHCSHRHCLGHRHLLPPAHAYPLEVFLLLWPKENFLLGNPVPHPTPHCHCCHRSYTAPLPLHCKHF